MLKVFSAIMGFIFLASAETMTDFNAHYLSRHYFWQGFIPRVSETANFEYSSFSILIASVSIAILAAAFMWGKAIRLNNLRIRETISALCLLPMALYCFILLSASNNINEVAIAQIFLLIGFGLMAINLFSVPEKIKIFFGSIFFLGVSGIAAYQIGLMTNNFRAGAIICLAGIVSCCFSALSVKK
jgi:hypothetical protein